MTTHKWKDIKNQMTQDRQAKIDAEVKEASDKMEIDFNNLRTLIHNQIAIAAQAMKEANKLAHDAGIPCLNADSEEDKELVNKLDIRIFPLFRELDEAGWQTSSIGC